MVLQVPREDATVILTMDVSGSMRATDVSPTRLDAAKASALSFVDQLPENVRVGVVAFASEPVTLVTPTTDRVQVKSAINSLTARDGTAMGDALMQVLDIADKVQQEGAETPDATAAPNASAAPNPSASPDSVGGARRASRWSPRSCCRTGPTRSDRRSRSMRPSVPRPWASRSTPSRLGTPDGTVDVQDNLGQTVTLNVPPDTETLKQIAVDHRRAGVRRADRRRSWRASTTTSSRASATPSSARK